MRVGLSARIGRGVRFGVDERSNYAPSDEGGLVLDFDLTVASSYTVATGAISQITNIASGVSWPQATAGKRAAYDATGWNGGPCMVPDGIDDIYLSTEAAVLAVANAPVTAPPYCVFMVCSPLDAINSSTVFGVGNTGFSNSHRRKWGQSSNGRWGYSHGKDDATTVTLLSAGAADAVIGTKRLLSFWGQTSHSVQCDRRAVSTASGSPVATTINQAALFSRPDSAPDNNWMGKFVRLLIFNSQLTADARARVQDHLQFKHLT
jgi:hypothetical protein